MKNELTNREHSFRIDLNDINVQERDLDKMAKAWELGDYRIVYAVYQINSNVYLEISTTRDNRNRDNDITRQWKEVMEELRQQRIPGFMLDKAKEEMDMVKEAEKTSATELEGEVMTQEEAKVQVEETESDKEEVAKSDCNEKIEMTANGEEVTKDDAGEVLNQELETTQTQAPTVKKLSDLRTSLQGDFPVYIPQEISRQHKYEVFEGNDDLKEYIAQTFLEKPSLKIWPQWDNSGRMQVRYIFHGEGAKEYQTGSIQRRQLFPEVRNCLDFLWDYRKMDYTIIHAAYNILNKIAPKLEESNEVADSSMGFEETYAMMVSEVLNRIQKPNQDETGLVYADFKSKRINDIDYVCIRGKDALDSVLKDIGTSMKKMELLNKLRDPEDGMSFLLINDGRMYDHRGKGDLGSWWYYIRVDKEILSKYIENEEEKEEEKYA